MDSLIRHRLCHRCNQITRQEIQKQITESSSENYGWFCLSCHWWTKSKNGGFWITKDELIQFGLDLDLVRVAEIRSGTRCARCGRRGAELHHWAPEALFGKEKDKWPTDYLCVECHIEWGKKVTPYLFP